MNGILYHKLLFFLKYKLYLRESLFTSQEINLYQWKLSHDTMQHHYSAFS